MIPTCPAPVAGGVVIVTLLGFGMLWIAQGIPNAIALGVALAVGVLGAFVAAPAVGAGVDEVLVYSAIAGSIIAAAVGNWRFNEMFARATTYALAFVGVLSFLAPYVVRAPQTQPGGMGATFHFIVGEFSRTLSSSFVTLASALPGLGC